MNWTPPSIREVLKRLLLTLLAVLTVIEGGLHFHVSAFLTGFCALVFGNAANALVPRD